MLPAAGAVHVKVGLVLVLALLCVMAVVPTCEYDGQWQLVKACSLTSWTSTAVRSKAGATIKVAIVGREEATRKGASYGNCKYSKCEHARQRCCGSVTLTSVGAFCNPFATIVRAASHDGIKASFEAG